MNLLKLDRYLLFRLDAIRQAGTTISAMWQQEERLQALNNGRSEVEKLIRKNRRDHFTRRRTSLDGVVWIRNGSFDTAGLRILPNVSVYTLPPDYLEIRGIRPLTVGRESVTFQLVTEDNQDFRDQRRTTLTAPNLPGLYFGAITGERTLTLAPTPQETLDIEVAYVAEMEPMVLYNQGNVTFTANSTSVLLSNGANFAEELSGIRPGDEILVSVTTVATPNMLTQRYPKILTVSAAGTDAGITESWPAASLNGVVYTVASVPQFHEDWHYAIAYWAVWELLKPIEMGAETSKQAAQADWDRVSAALVPESAQRQSQNTEVAEDGWYGFE